jgi:hypothetical protein
MHAKALTLDVASKQLADLWVVVVDENAGSVEVIGIAALSLAWPSSNLPAWRSTRVFL